MTVVVDLAGPGDAAVADELVAGWGGAVARLGALVETSRLPRLVARRAGVVVGVLTFRLDGDECEVVTLDAPSAGEGTGRALMAAVAKHAGEQGCTRVWLVTTNDNTRAMRFYQRLGMDLRDVRLGAVDEARATLKPSIPQAGADGIPIRHELVFELKIAPNG